MIILTALALFLSSTSSFATDNQPTGVAFELGFGLGSALIKNPDESNAHYSLWSAEGKVHIPAYDSTAFSANFLGSLRYLNLENTANSSIESEQAHMFGPGAGLHLRLYKFFAGFEYHLLTANHQTVGTISHNTKYNMATSCIYGGLIFTINQLSVSLAVSQASGNIPKQDSALSKDVPYSDQAYWLQLTYSTQTPFTQFFSFLH